METLKVIQLRNIQALLVAFVSIFHNYDSSFIHHSKEYLGVFNYFFFLKIKLERKLKDATERKCLVDTDDLLELVLSFHFVNDVFE